MVEYLGCSWHGYLIYVEFFFMQNLEMKFKNESSISHETLPYCFVAYKSILDATVAGDGLAWDHYPDKMLARICPGHDDIIWRNLKRDRRIR